MLTTLGLAAVLFASTNIDDLFVLLGLFADPRFRGRQIAAGQYLGIAVLVAASYLASRLAMAFPPAWVGLLGVLPILIGLKWLFDLLAGGGDDAVDVAPRAGWGNAAAVAAVTVANGGDNLGIYTPVFSGLDDGQLAWVLAVFAVMVAAWLVFARWLVRHPALGAPIRRYGHVVTPFVLIAIGAYVMVEAGTLGLLEG